MTTKEMFNKARIEAESYVKRNELNVIIYMSGSKHKKTKFEKLLKEYKDNSNFDFEIGVIDKTNHEFEMKAYEILRKSIENYSIY